MNNNVTLSGRLRFLPFGDLIQLLGSNGSTGVLRLVSQWADDPGFVYFADGNPVNAQNGNKEGLDALYSMFGWVDGDFEFVSEPIIADKTITKSRMGIILEGMKLLDDGHIEKLDAPPQPGTVAPDVSSPSSSAPESRIVKGPLVDYMYVVDEEDFFDGEHIVEEGKHGSWMWVILEGIVDIQKEGPSGRIPIIRIGDGSFIGSMASFLLQGHIRTASAIAVGNVQLGVLDSQRLAQEYASLSYPFRMFLTSLDKRLKHLTERSIQHYLNDKRADNLLKDQKLLVKQGKTKDEQIFIIKQGRASVVRNTPSGPVVLCQLGKGDFFGNIPFLHMGQEPEQSAIYGSEDIKISKTEVASLSDEFNGLSVTFKNIVNNMATCMTFTADSICEARRSKQESIAADTNARQKQ